MDLEALLKECAIREAENEVISRQSKAERERLDRGLAGSYYDQLASDRDFAVKALRHSNVSICGVAMSMFPYHWPADALVEQICLENTFGPSTIRGGALGTLASIRNACHAIRVSI